MNNRICNIILLICLLSISSIGLALPQNEAQRQLNKLAQQYEKDFFAHFPEEGTFWGKAGVAQNRFMNHSIPAHIRWQQKEDSYLQALNEINERDLSNSPEHNTYSLLKATLENNRGARKCHEELWNIDPLFGWHNELALVAEKQLIGTEEYRAMALERWRSFDKVVNDEINNLKEGLKTGYTAPKPAIDRVLAQLKMILSYPIQDSPYYDFAKRDGDKRFQQQVANIIETVINPSIQRYIDFIETDYYSHARTIVGVKANPNGAACYQAKIIQQTTLDITPEEIHAIGLLHMDELADEVAKIGNKEFGLQGMADVFQKVKNDPQFLFSSEQSILDYNYAALDRVKAKVGDWFDLMPQSEGIIKPYPEHRAATGAAGEYSPPSEDGSEPGIFYINTYKPEQRSRVDNEATLFHELIPGHHFQVALSAEDKTHLSLDKYLWNSGYGEGWALYVERLADEMHLYKDDISRLGMLSNEALRTARLVVDSGMHVLDWTREDAVLYLQQHSALDENIIESEIDRYIMMPGQATAYMLGKLEIEDLRELAKEEQGDQFDIRQFHNQVLKNGSVTLPMLREQIEAWVG